MEHFGWRCDLRQCHDGRLGRVSSANSLVGSNAFEYIGGSQGISVLSNGNYAVVSAGWNGNRGAVTFGNGNTGVAGPVSSANSLVGSTAGDLVGGGSTNSYRVTELPSGNYVVVSPNWNDGATVKVGAVTWVNGTNGNIAGSASPGGVVSSANSLIGSHANDKLGYALDLSNQVIPGVGLVVLTNGNYVVNDPSWNGGLGAVSWVYGSSGNLAGASSPGGVVSASNSLVGSTAGDQVGVGGVSVLPVNGNYVVNSFAWRGTGGLPAGAVTLGSGTTGNFGGGLGE